MNKVPHSTVEANVPWGIIVLYPRELLKPSASVALHKHSNALVDILPPEADSSIAMLQAHEKPDVAYSGWITLFLCGTYFHFK